MVGGRERRPAGREALTARGDMKPDPWAIRWDKVCYWFRKSQWLIPVVLAVLTFVGVLLAVPLSGKSAPDRMSAAFATLAAASLVLAVAAFALNRRTFRVAKVGLVVLYVILAVPTALVGVIDVLPDSAYRHRFGAPLLLALSTAGIVGLLAAFVLGWLAPQTRKSPS